MRTLHALPVKHPLFMEASSDKVLCLRIVYGLDKSRPALEVKQRKLVGYPCKPEVLVGKSTMDQSWRGGVRGINRAKMSDARHPLIVSDI